MAKSRKHAHQYYRAQMQTGGFLWTCASADCSHHMPQHYENTLVGKSFTCWECNQIDILRKEHLQANPEYFMSEDRFPSRPRCINCVQGNQNIDEVMLDNLIKSMDKH